MELINIENKDGQLLVSSREVAENFGKEHKDVLEAVRNLIAENSAVNEMVFESSYTSDRGREYPEYLLNRDGFTLLAMGFTGDKALQWKLKYINAFNQMENSIKQQTIPSDLSPQLQLLINMELKQKEMEKAVIETKQEIQGMRDVITDDKKLIEGYTAIIKEMAIKHGVA